MSKPLLKSIVSELPRLYRIYLARYLLFRWLKEFLLSVYRNFYQARCAFFGGYKSEEFELLSMSSFSRSCKISSILFEPSKQLEIGAPRFFDSEFKTVVNEKTVVVSTPKLEIVELSDSMVVGGDNLIFSDNCAIYPDIMDMRINFSPAETYGISVINKSRSKLKLYLAQRPETIECAINLLSQNARNYAHFLTEVLTKLIIVDACDKYKHLPLLIDAWMHPNFYSAIELLNVNKRKIIKVDRWSAISLRRVIDISLPGYEPFVPDKIGIQELDVFVNKFSPIALKMLREAAYGAINCKNSIEFKMLYFRRGNSANLARRLTNAEAVEEMLTEYGFKVVEPGEMSFSDQVLLCKNADVIISPVGACLANMVFARIGCKFIALAPYYDDGNYYYYSNMAGVLGHELCYYLGWPKEKGGHRRHRDYTVDLRRLQKELVGFI